MPCDREIRKDTRGLTKCDGVANEWTMPLALHNGEHVMRVTIAPKIFLTLRLNIGAYQSLEEVGN